MSYEERLGDYVDVATRLVEFRSKHPDGSLQPVDPAHPFELVTIGEKQFIVYKAAAYRDRDDPRPGIGTAWEPFPGKTPYTKDSEVMVAETSAWGRAIVAALAADTKKGIASKEEVRNRQAERRPVDPEKMRRDVMQRATSAIAEATERGELDSIGHRIAASEEQQRITAADAIELRRLLVAKLDELYPDAQTPEVTE